MAKFMAIYLGTATADEKARGQIPEEVIARGMQAWQAWGERHAGAIIDGGGPLGKTKKASAAGLADTRNSMTGYVIVEADSHEAAVRMFEGHPHFSIFPGDSVEVMECLPIPGS